MLGARYIEHKTILINEVDRFQGSQLGQGKQLKLLVGLSEECTITNWDFERCSSLSGLKRRAGCCQKQLGRLRNKGTKLIALADCLPQPNLFHFQLKKGRQPPVHLHNKPTNQSVCWLTKEFVTLMMSNHAIKFCFLQDFRCSLFQYALHRLVCCASKPNSSSLKSTKLRKACTQISVYLIPNLFFLYWMFCDTLDEGF